MSDYFFDTSILIAYLKDEDVRSVSLVEEVIARAATASISAVTVAEIWAAQAASDPEVQTRRRALLSLMFVIPIDTRVAEHAGNLRRLFNLKIPDALVAAAGARSGGRFFSKDDKFTRLLNAGILIGEVYA